eukprot:CAMPEP_0169297734 /NCGR_PEP_ID=MMETSP1016-20121227/65942_1 /TAXON_ID=342587 /ORGANISM="Karlodinium micrum, Strain CCMP2283" /LENGTH=118 /DNA_ID=CAMNT_0009389433 /DNA_START=395 /DNA_END=748 /DNA_ORIENTATION=-
MASPLSSALKEPSAIARSPGTTCNDDTLLAEDSIACASEDWEGTSVGVKFSALLFKVTLNVSFFGILADFLSRLRLPGGCFNKDGLKRQHPSEDHFLTAPTKAASVAYPLERFSRTAA